MEKKLSNEELKKVSGGYFDCSEEAIQRVQDKINEINDDELKSFVQKQLDAKVNSNHLEYDLEDIYDLARAYVSNNYRRSFRNIKK